MRDTIYTIPISEVFEPRDGCPLCRMRDMLEERSIEYIMGAAMMEPDVRQDTNRVGFCTEHFRMMLPRKNRLSVGLMLQSHLEYIQQEIANTASPSFGKDKRPSLAAGIEQGCFVCGRMAASMDRMLDTTLNLWAKEGQFRELFASQEFLCFTHYAQLLRIAQAKMNKKVFPEFSAALSALTLKKLTALKADIDKFCNLFDYRSPSAGPVPEQIKTSLERSAQYLTSRSMGEEQQQRAEKK